MASFKHLFSRSLAAAPGRLHFAAHSHHLWPDASWEGQREAWEDAAALANRKWDKVLDEVWPEAQGHVVEELDLPDPATVCFAPNTHELVARLVSALPMAKPRVLATTGEFHSFRRQALRWHEAGAIELVTVTPAALVDTARTGGFDLVFASHVAFATGRLLGDLAPLAALARPDGPWVCIDGYHGFMAIPADLSAHADQLFYLAGGYKYAMSGEGAAFIHAPPGYAQRPVFTGWYADSEDGAYPADARRFLGSTFDPSGLYRFVHVRRMLAAEGLTPAAVAAFCDGLKTRLLAADALPGLTLVSDPAVRFLAFQGPHAAAIQTALAARGVVTDSRNDVLRIGFGLYQDEADVDRLVEILCEVA